MLASATSAVALDSAQLVDRAIALAAFRGYAQLLDPPIEVVRIPFERREIGFGLARGRRRPRLGHDARRRGNDGEREDGGG